MAQFKVTQESSEVDRDVWQGEVEYNGETLQYRYWDSFDGQEVYVLTEQGWEAGTDLGHVLYAAIQEWGHCDDFGSVGEICEIDDELVEEYK